MPATNRCITTKTPADQLSRILSRHRQNEGAEIILNTPRSEFSSMRSRVKNALTTPKSCPQQFPAVKLCASKLVE